MTTVHQRSLTLGFSVTAMLLVLASTAMACTVFAGKLAVTPLAAGSGMSQATGNGKDMARCDVSENAAIPITGDKVQVAVTGATGCSAAKLAEDTYSVNYASDGAYDCMTIGRAVPGVGAPLGTFLVNSSGFGSTTVTVPGLSSSPTSIALCVTSTDPRLLLQGNRVKLTVI